MFENKLNAILTEVNKTGKITCLTGDFNIDLLKSDDCDYSNRFCEQLFTSSFYPLINRPTRITQHTATLIDNIFIIREQTIATIFTSQARIYKSNRYGKDKFWTFSTKVAHCNFQESIVNVSNKFRLHVMQSEETGLFGIL